MSTQPYQSPDPREPRKKDPALEPVAEETTQQLIEGAEQQVGAGEQLERRGVDQDDPRAAQQGHVKGRGAQGGAGSIGSGADPAREMPSAAEAEDRGSEEQRLKDDEEASELDEALEETFPASDPPSRTTKGRVK